MKNKIIIFLKEEKWNIFITAIILIILFFSFFIKNNFALMPPADSFGLNNLIQEKQAERKEKFLVAKKQEIIAFKDDGCVAISIDGKECSLESQDCIDNILIPSQVKCSLWEFDHIKKPEIIKSIYYTTYSAVNSTKIQNLIDLVKNTEINSVVIDIKEVDGKVAFAMDNYNFGTIKPSSNYVIKDPKALVDRLHQNGIYVIGRIVVFKDKILAENRPDLAIKTSDKNTVWADYKGKKYMDPNNQEVWEYNLNIARAIYLTGFDEVNFDYIRFPSDGDMSDMFYPFSQDEILADEKWGRSKIIDKFFNFLTSNLKKEFPKIQLSADLFGYTAIVNDDLKIGQILESALLYFDRVGPMTYPSHYNEHFMGLDSADSHPYEVIKYTMENVNQKIFDLNSEIALAKLENRKIKLKNNFLADLEIDKVQNLNEIAKDKLMIWIQGFTCTWCGENHIDYGREQVQAQSSAAAESGYNNWFIWNASSNYQKDWFIKNN